MSIQIGLEIILNMSLFIILGNLSNSLPRAAAVHIPPGDMPPAPTEPPAEPRNAARIASNLDYILHKPRNGTRKPTNPRHRATERPTEPRKEARQGNIHQNKKSCTDSPSNAHRGQKKTAHAGRLLSYLFIFNKSANTTNGKIKMQNIINPTFQTSSFYATVKRL